MEESLFTRATGWGTDLGYAAGWGAIKYAPAGLAERAFRLAADAAARRDGRGVQQLRKNLRRVVGADVPGAELDSLVRDAMRSYARYWLETFRLPRMDHVDVVANTYTEGAQHLDAALAAGRGAVVALPHQGNWDVAGLWLVAHHGSFATVAERLKPESLFDRFVAYRESLGFEVVPLTGGDRSPMGVLTERLKQNKAVCLLADRDLSAGGIEVTFFGEATRMPPGPALLAVTTGAPLLPVSLWFTPDGRWGQRINAPIEVPEGRLRNQVATMTQQLASTFEKGVAEHPADWHMLQRFWLADTSGAKP